MNICLLNDSFPPVIDGVVNVVLNYAKYLMQDHGAQIVVGTPNYPGADYSVYDFPVIPYQSFDTAAVTSGYRTGNPFSEKSVSALARTKPDIIHTHCPASATVIARILREECQAPVVFTYHTKYDIDIRRVVKAEPLAREGIKAMVSNISACDDVWVVSRGAGENLRDLGFQGDYLVMNNGVDFDRGRVDEAEVARVCAGYDLPEDVPVYLFVGRMMTYKGLPLILDALRLVKDAGQDFRMVFIGKGPDLELLQEKARELGLMDEEAAGDGENIISGGKCIFLGAIYDRDVLRAWNTRADLFLFPSTFDTNGLVVREAAACGLASVLIKDSCAAEGVTNGRNGFIIEENAQAMADLLLKVSGDLSHLKQVGDHAMNEIYLSWQTCVAQAYDRYQILLEKKREGLLGSKIKQPTDYLVSMTARGMSERDRIRRLGEEWFNGFKESAVGMMENVQEFEEEAHQLTERVKGAVSESVKETMQERKKAAEKMREEIRKETSYEKSSMN